MARYNLSVKVKGKWQRLQTIEAAKHQEAFSKAQLVLKKEHGDKPIKLEQEDPRAASRTTPPGTSFTPQRDPDESRGGR